MDHSTHTPESRVGWGSVSERRCVLSQDLKANESRLRDINKVASELESEGLMAEEAPMVQSQVPSTHTRTRTHTGRHAPVGSEGVASCGPVDSRCFYIMELDGLTGCCY